MPVSWRFASLMLVTLDDTAAIAVTVSSTACWMSWISVPISPVALAVCCASDFTSEATTAKPRPAAPARAASMVALSASSEVCAATPSISLTTAPMRSAAAARLRTMRSVRPSWSTVRSVAFLAAATSLLERAISASSSRAAFATAPTSRAAASAAPAACDVRECMSLLRLPRSAAVTLISSPALSKAVDQLGDGRAEALGEERAAGVMELGLGLAAALIDDERVGIDQRLPHPLRGGRDVGHGAAAGALRQRGVAVAGGDQRDRVDHRAQPPLDPPGGDGRRPPSRRPARRARSRSRTTAKAGTAAASRTGSKIQPAATTLRSSNFIGKASLKRIPPASRKLSAFAYQILFNTGSPTHQLSADAHKLCAYGSRWKMRQGRAPGRMR